MKVSLQIKRKNLDLIKSGVKKTEWREPSVYNKRKLFCDNGTGKLDGNPAITSIELINGYSSNREIIEVEVTRIRLVKFTRDVNIPEDNFRALKDQFAIEINLGSIIS